MPNLARTFDIVRPVFSAEVMTGDIAARIRELAGRLRLTSAVGFECRLTADDPQIDLQLGIPFSAAVELVTVCETVLASLPGETAESARQREIWTRLHEFSLDWVKPNTVFHREIVHVWLEFDVPVNAEAPLIPSVFATFRPEGGAAAWAVMEELIRFLPGAGMTAGLESTLALCRRACSAPAYLGHAGFMLARPVPGCRVDISELPVGSFATFLWEIQWPGDIAAVQTWAEELRQLVDSVVLCLNAGDVVYPQIGLEAFFKDPDDAETPWAPLLEYLVARGLCCDSKRHGLLGWNGVITPVQCAAVWPEELIVESLLQPADSFGLFRRRLNHVKISLSPGRAPQAKAYFGYAHEWRQWDGK